MLAEALRDHSSNSANDLHTHRAADPGYNSRSVDVLAQTDEAIQLLREFQLVSLMLCF
jgi:hypothetical protein